MAAVPAATDETNPGRFMKTKIRRRLKSAPKGDSHTRRALTKGARVGLGGCEGEELVGQPKRRFRQMADRSIESGKWVLVVVALFILLPAAVMYLVSRTVKDPEPIRMVKKEADILAPVNIFSNER